MPNGSVAAASAACPWPQAPSASSPTMVAPTSCDSSQWIPRRRYVVATTANTKTERRRSVGSFPEAHSVDGLVGQCGQPLIDRSWCLHFLGFQLGIQTATRFNARSARASSATGRPAFVSLAATAACAANHLLRVTFIAGQAVIHRPRALSHCPSWSSIGLSPTGTVPRRVSGPLAVGDCSACSAGASPH